MRIEFFHAGFDIVVSRFLFAMALIIGGVFATHQLWPIVVGMAVMMSGILGMRIKFGRKVNAEVPETKETKAAKPGIALDRKPESMQAA